MTKGKAGGIRIFHQGSGDLIAEGPLSWRGILSFEGNFYIPARYLKTQGFRRNWVPGFCFYKFFYVWLDFRGPDGSKEPFLGWLYWLPNPMFFFIAFRTAVPMSSPALRIEALA
jgi:hypothetical protein